MSKFTCFSLIFWGLLLVLIDVRISGFDLFPNFIGYILTAIGCAGLSRLSSRFTHAKTFGWILSILSLVMYFVGTELLLSFNIVNFALNLGMIWFLFAGIMDLSFFRQRPDITLHASRLRLAYVLLMTVGTAITLLASDSQDIATVASVAVFVIILPLIVLMLLFIQKVKREICN